MYGSHRFDCLSEMMEYTRNLPDTNLDSVKNTILEIWENRTRDFAREEWGTFQIFDSGYNLYFKGERGIEEMESKLNDYLIESGYPLKVSISQIHLSIPPFAHRIPTQTFEVVVFDNTFYESLDPIWTEIIENESLKELK